MNGRMYDANLGRFLSPDNFIQDPYNTQNFNRYGYVLNNPLLYSDPSGEFIFEAITLFTIVKAIFVASAVVGAYALITNLNDASGSSESNQNIGPVPSNSSNSSEIASSGIRGVKIEGSNFEVPYGVAPWHRYKIDSQGNVTYYDNKGGDEVDYLMNESDQELVVNSRDILPQLAKQRSDWDMNYAGSIHSGNYAITNNFEQAKRIFQFASRASTNAEWLLAKHNNQTFLGTNHYPDAVNSRSTLDVLSLQKHYHSHPGLAIIDDRASGYSIKDIQTMINKGFSPSNFGDVGNAQSIYNDFIEAGKITPDNGYRGAPLFYIYRPHTNKSYYFRYDPWNTKH